MRGEPSSSEFSSDGPTGGRHYSYQPSMLSSAAPSSLAEEPAGEPDEERGSKMKKISQQRPLRALVCLAALSIFVFGIFTAVIGIYALSSASWMSTSFGSHSSQVTTSSILLGILTSLLSLVGCLGALKRKKPHFCCFGLIVLALLTIFAGGLSILFELEWTLEQWSEQHYRLFASTPAGSNLSGVAEELLHTLYIELGAVYAFCAPNATGVGAAIAALDEHAAPPTGALSCRQADSIAFAEWVNLECLAPTRFAVANASATLFGEIGACRADLAAAQAAGRFEAHVGSSVGDTAWLFCACGRPLKTTLEAEWISPTRTVLTVLVVYCALTSCVLYLSCAGADKAKKRKKKNKMELIILKQAAQENGLHEDENEGL